MKKTAGRLPSSAGGLYSFGAFFSRKAGYGVITTSAFGSRPKRSGIGLRSRKRRLRVRDLLCPALELVLGVRAQLLQRRRHVLRLEKALRDRFHFRSERLDLLEPQFVDFLRGLGNGRVIQHARVVARDSVGIVRDGRRLPGRRKVLLFKEVRVLQRRRVDAIL